MRFDDRLATALAQPAEVPAARQAVWRQLVDLLAQAPQDHPHRRVEALARLEQWRAEVPAIVRQGVALLLADRPVPPDLVRFFAVDTAAVSAPFLSSVHMQEEEWAELIPTLSPVARALLRHRRDLPMVATRALSMFGSSDLILETTSTYVDDAATEELPQIASALATELAFEAGPDGVIRWSDLTARGALVGLSIAHPASPEASGVDGQASGAFQRRTAFKDARLVVGGQTAASGAWTIAGVPVFEPISGRFTGYRGSARRPRAGERAEPVLGADGTRDSLRQLSHELRTPLNAIGGFAEMIEQQMLGPIQPSYRQRAAAILTDTRRIETVLNDLDEAAQIDVASVAPDPVPVDCALMIAKLVSMLSPVAAERDVAIALTIAPRCASALMDPVSAERMARRLLSSAIGLAAPGEQVDVAVSPGDCHQPQSWIAVSRPKLLAGMDEARMLAACDLDGEDADAAPPLGLGFSLRVIRSLAEGCGGQLILEPDSFSLRLPAVVDRQRRNSDEPDCLDARSLAE